MARAVALLMIGGEFDCRLCRGDTAGLTGGLFAYQFSTTSG